MWKSALKRCSISQILAIFIRKFPQETFYSLTALSSLLSDVFLITFSRTAEEHCVQVDRAQLRTRLLADRPVQRPDHSQKGPPLGSSPADLLPGEMICPIDVWSIRPFFNQLHNSISHLHAIIFLAPFSRLGEKWENRFFNNSAEFVWVQFLSHVRVWKNTL